MLDRRGFLKTVGAGGLLALMGAKPSASAPTIAISPLPVRWPHYVDTIAIDGSSGLDLEWLEEGDADYARELENARACGQAAIMVTIAPQGRYWLDDDAFHRAVSKLDFWHAVAGKHSDRLLLIDRASDLRRAHGEHRLGGSRGSRAASRSASTSSASRCSASAECAWCNSRTIAATWSETARRSRATRVEQLRPPAGRGAQCGADRGRPRAWFAANHRRRHRRIEGADADQPYRLPRARRPPAQHRRCGTARAGRARRRGRDHLLALPAHRPRSPWRSMSSATSSMRSMSPARTTWASAPTAASRRSSARRGSKGQSRVGARVEGRQHLRQWPSGRPLHLHPGPQRREPFRGAGRDAVRAGTAMRASTRSSAAISHACSARSGARKRAPRAGAESILAAVGRIAAGDAGAGPWRRKHLKSRGGMPTMGVLPHAHRR